MSARGWLTTLMMASLLLACSDEVVAPNADPGPDNPPGEPEPDPGAATFCGQLGYPCTIDQVDPAVGERSQALLEDAKARVESGQSNLDAVRWLSEQDGVADASATEALIVFRLEGGQPTWLLTSTGTVPQSTMPEPPGPLADDVVGHGTARERADKKKKAIVLSPFQFQFGTTDVGPVISGALQSHRDYRGRVRFKGNASRPALPNSDTGTTGVVTVEDFQGWGEFDVIAISTHGNTLVELSSDWGCILLCIAGVSTGQRVRNCDAVIRARYSELQGVRCGSVSGVTGTYLWLDSDFFRWEYRLAFALSKSVVYFGACRTYDNSSLALQLGASTNEFFGWDDTVDSSDELDVVRRLFGLMVTGGLTTVEAFDQLESEGVTSTPSADLRHRSNETGLHIREITTLKNPMHPSVGFGAAPLVRADRERDSFSLRAADDDGNLEPGSVLPFLGQSGDGQNDEIFFYVDVDGVRAGRESEFSVVVELDQEELGTWSLEGDHARRVGEFTVRLRIRQPLNFDVVAGLTLELAATTHLPGEDEGESEHEVSVVFQNPTLHIQSTIQTSGGDVTAFSEVEGEVDLTFVAGDGPGELVVDQSLGPLRYTQFDISLSSATGCSVGSSTQDGRLRIVEGSIPFNDPQSDRWGIPEELLIFPLPEISEVVTLSCSGASQTLDFVHWFAGFLSHHGGGFGGVNEVDEARGGLVITGWVPGADDVYARKTYSRTGQDDEGVTSSEETVLELRGPAYRPN